MQHSRSNVSVSSRSEAACRSVFLSASHTNDRTRTKSRFGSVLQGNRGLTLIEVAVASFLLTMMLVGVLQAMLQSRRLTEGSIRQGTVASLVQGYLEQIKSIDFTSLPISPATTPGLGTPAAWKAYAVTVKDSYQNDTTIYLAAGNAPVTLPAISTLPTDASLRTEAVDIDNTNSALDNTTLNMWVWINDLSDGGNVTNCKSIVIVYEWRIRDGGITKSYRDSMRTIRSSISTY